MKILFNCIVNKKGGAVQNAANFINLASRDETIDFIFLVSEEVNSLLECWQVRSNKIYVFDHPKIDQTVKDKIAVIEDSFKPDIAYTMAGPSYIKFKSKHVLGISDPYITHAKLRNFFEGRSIYDGSLFFVKNLIKSFLSRIEGDFYVFQTFQAKSSYGKKWFVKSSKSCVVSNAISRVFIDGFSSLSKKGRDGKKFVFLCPAAHYPHKNLDIIRDVIYLIASDVDFTNIKKQIVFRTTVPEESPFLSDVCTSAHSKAYVDNIGPYSYATASEVYAQADAVFMPTLLETFSTSYLEALAAKKMLLCSDEDFAREICKDAALYFNGRSPRSAFNAIKDTVFGNYQFPESAAEKVIGEYGEYSQRYKLIIECLKRFRY